MELDGRTLLARLQDRGLQPGAFGHREHVHAAWQCLREAPLRQAAQRFAGLLRAYVRHVGAEDKYHHTLTLALMHLIHARVQRAPDAGWDAFAAANGDLFSDARALIARHYSPECLAAPAARQDFVAPDRAALP